MLEYAQLYSCIQSQLPVCVTVPTSLVAYCVQSRLMWLAGQVSDSGTSTRTIIAGRLLSTSASSKAACE